MAAIREYILSIISAAVISGILYGVLDSKGLPGSFGKLFCGIFLSIVLINPLTNLSFDGVTDWIESCGAEGERYVSDGEKMSAERMRENISAQCEAYILDKAARMGLDVEVRVALSCTAPYPPESVTIHGAAPPYGRSALNDVISEDLAVQKENIQWK